MNRLPLGKLPPELLNQILQSAPISDERVLLGPGTGLDCAALALGDTVLVFKSDPITFASEEIGWYAVQVCANDIATSGAVPRWFLTTLLLPGGQADAALALEISGQVANACRALDISLIGEHTEVTYGLERPIIMGTMVGEVPRAQWITPRGMMPGQRLLLSGGVPIEAVSIAAREFGPRLRANFSGQEIAEAAAYLHTPGISVLSAARLALQAGTVSAMHDPTEGGLACALWEMAEAAGVTLAVNLDAVHIPELARRVCASLGMNPLEAIASGALLMSVSPGDAAPICATLQAQGIPCTEIAQVHPPMSGCGAVFDRHGAPIPRPQRDEIARLYEEMG